MFHQAGAGCPMRKKGKCIFAHGPIELRIKETRRDRWGISSTPPTTITSLVSISSPPNSSQSQSNTTSSTSNTAVNSVEVSKDSTLLLLRLSGGEDVLGAARQIEKVRHFEGSVSDFEKQSSSSTSLQHFHHHSNNTTSSNQNGMNNNSSNNSYIRQQYQLPMAHLHTGPSHTHPPHLSPQYYPQSTSVYFQHQTFGR